MARLAAVPHPSSVGRHDCGVLPVRQGGQREAGHASGRRTIDRPPPTDDRHRATSAKGADRSAGCGSLSLASAHCWTAATVTPAHCAWRAAFSRTEFAHKGSSQALPLHLNSVRRLSPTTRKLLHRLIRPTHPTSPHVRPHTVAALDSEDTRSLTRPRRRLVTDCRPLGLGLRPSAEPRRRAARGRSDRSARSDADQAERR